LWLRIGLICAVRATAETGATDGWLTSTVVLWAINMVSGDASWALGRVACDEVPRKTIKAEEGSHAHPAQR
jgi:hypothetical protein